MAVNKRLLQGAAAAGGLVPSEHFGVVLYEGDGSSSHSINGGKFGAGAYMSSPSSNAQYIALPNGIINGATGNISVSFWMNTTYSTAQMFILATDITPYYSKIAINTETNGKLRLSYGNASNAENNFYTTSTNLLNGNWHHIVYTLDIANTTAKIYVNGSLETTHTTTVTPALVASPTLTIGNVYRSDTSAYQTNSYKGKLDQFRFFINILSSSQVSTLYAETAATVESLDPLSEDTTDTLQVLGDTSCIATYRFENDEVDLSGNYDGTGTAIQYAAGRYGQAASFNGSSSAINTSYTPTVANLRTVSFWFKTDTTSFGTMFTVGPYGINSDYQWALASVNSNGTVSAGYGANNGGAVYLKITTGTFNDNNWHHLVLTLNGVYGSSSSAKLYIDGVEPSTTTDTTHSSATSTIQGTFRIGHGISSGANAYVYEGELDQVRVFNKEVSASEVTTLYNENPLVASYRFEGNSNDDMRTYNGTDTNVTYEYGLGFTPDFVWIKNRDTARGHNIFDSTRGINKVLFSNSTSDEGSESAGTSLSSFDTGGFTVGSGNGVNENGDEMVAWCWKANGGTTSSNTDGSITSTVQVNSSAGFSIVKYDGGDISGSTSTVGHGLDSAPELIIVKTYETGLSPSEWFVYSQDVGNTKEGYLNQSAAFGTDTDRWNSTSPTSSVFTLGSSWSDYPGYYAGDTIAYCFHSVDGFSKIGSYTGNGSTNGPIVETGFEPAFLMIKMTSGTGSWFMWDNKRSTTNPRKPYLYAQSANEEADDLGGVDFLSNGFQLKDSYSFMNGNNSTFIYMAFAADPDTEAPTVAKSFNIKTYAGNESTQSITGVGFSPSLVWVKGDTSNVRHMLFDTLRGTGNYISSNLSNAEISDSNSLTSFDADGFSVGNLNWSNYGVPYIAWTWKADDNEPTIFGGPAIAVYKFEDNANDVTGSFNGTANNITYATGNFNKAAVFNGSSSGVDIGNLGIGGAAARTISAWVYVDSLSSAQTIFQYGANSNGQRFGFAIDTAGKIYVEYYNRDAITSASHISTNTWYHLAVTYNGGAVQTAANTQIYVDGVAVSMSVTGGQTGNANTGDSNYGIGYDRLNTRQYFDGKIDQVRIYKGALGEYQISELYAETVTNNDDITFGGLPVTLISANANAGFSIVKSTTPSSPAPSDLVAHGLSSAPDMIIYKPTTVADDWYVYHSAMGLNKFMKLQSTDAQATATDLFGTVNATGFSTKNTNTGNRPFIAYCFHSVSGYSKFGSYEGNQTLNTDNVVNFGFAPDFVMIKNADEGSSQWIVIDSVRTNGYAFYANTDGSESNYSTDILISSQGLRFVSTNVNVNKASRTYIYMAFKIN